MKKKGEKTMLLQIDTEINKEGKVCAIHSFASRCGGETITEFAGRLKDSHFIQLGFYSNEKSLLEKFAEMYKKHKGAEEVLTCSLSDTKTCLNRMVVKGLLNKKDIVPISIGNWGM